MVATTTEATEITDMEIMDTVIMDMEIMETIMANLTMVVVEINIITAAIMASADNKNGILDSDKIICFFFVHVPVIELYQTLRHFLNKEINFLWNENRTAIICHLFHSSTTVGSPNNLLISAAFNLTLSLLML